MYDDPTPIDRRNRVAEGAVWFLLFALVALIAGCNALAPPPEDVSDPGGSLELRLQGRYAVGVKSLFGGMKSPLTEDLEPQLLEQLRAAAVRPDEKLLLVTLAGEIAGAETALEEIAALEEEDLSDEARRDLETLAKVYRGEEVGDAERQELALRRDWFGRLALSFGHDDDPERKALLGEAMKTAAILVAAVMVVLGAGGVGLVLLVLAIVFYRQGKLKPLYRPQAPPEPTRRLPYLETLVAFIVATLGVSAIAAVVAVATGSTAATLVVSMLAFPAVFWPLLRGQTLDELRSACGWHRGRGVLVEAGSGILGYVAGIPLILLGLGVSLLMASMVDKPPRHPLMEGVAGAGWFDVLVMYVLAAVWAPIVEETLFRGGFYHYLRGRLGIFASAFGVSVVFAVIHPQGILGVPPLVALAMVLALIREWRGSIIASVTVHAVHNAMATTLIVLMLG